ARGVTASRNHDLTTARKEIERAASAWPTQPAYLWGLVLVTSRQSDTAGLRNALRAYAALGLGRDLRADSTIARFLTLPGFATLQAEHDRNRVPLTRGSVLASFPDSTFWPEGTDYDSSTGRFYLASVRHRTVAEWRPGGSVR